MSGGEASAPADATPPDFCARRSSLEVFPVCSRRFPLFALSLFLALLLVPSRALAYDFIPKGLVYSADLDGSRYGAVAVAANQFDAACYALGKEPASISTSIRSKLSDPNYGGRFYDFSQAFFTQGWPLEEVPEWLPIYVWGSLEWSDLLLSDYQSVWYVTCTQSLRSGALADFLAVLNGEDLSGGGGGGGSVVPLSGYLAIPTYAWDDNEPRSTADKALYRNPAQNATYSDGNLVVGSGTSLYSPWINNSAYVPSGIFYANTDVLNLANNLIRQGYKVSFYSSLTSCGLVYARNLVRSYIDYAPDNSNKCYFFVGTDLKEVDFSSSIYFNSTDGVFCFVPNFENYSTTSRGSRFRYYYMADVYSEPFALPPSGTWPNPQTPVSPTAPELPEPVTPTVTPEPIVTEPTPTWPVLPTPTAPTVTLTDTPSGLDYTQLLTLINDNLNDINSYIVAINSNFNSLRSELVTEFDGVVQGLRNIYTYLQHMDSVLERHCIHLQNKMEDVSVDIQNKMRELVHWLAEQLDFDSESSGNSDLFGILSTINDKLGGGTYEPNPLKDVNAYYVWLDDLWDRFLLGDNWQSSASSMSQSFGQLTSRFPFSVPWDIVALFRLFVHDPVTPVFDLPLYYSSEDSATVRVDLSAWDGVASVVRPLVFVIFALKLALLSRHLLVGFGADKGGL